MKRPIQVLVRSDRSPGASLLAIYRSPRPRSDLQSVATSAQVELDQRHGTRLLGGLQRLTLAGVAAFAYDFETAEAGSRPLRVRHITAFRGRDAYLVEVATIDPEWSDGLAALQRVVRTWVWR